MMPGEEEEEEGGKKEKRRKKNRNKTRERERERERKKNQINSRCDSHRTKGGSIVSIATGDPPLRLSPNSASLYT